MYSKPLKLYKGVDNRVMIRIRNADQKLQNMLDGYLLFNLIDDSNADLIYSRYCDIIYDKQGVAYVEFNETELADVPAGNYTYSLVYTDSDNTQNIVFADLNYNARGVAVVTDSVYPTVKPSFKPNLGPYYNNNPNSTSGYSNNNVIYTDVIPVRDWVTRRGVMQTVQYNATNFTGTIETQVSMEPQPTANPNAWATIDTQTITNQTGAAYYNITGKFSQIRWHITTTSGSVDKILYRA